MTCPYGIFGNYRALPAKVPHWQHPNQRSVSTPRPPGRRRRTVDH